MDGTMLSKKLYLEHMQSLETRMNHVKEFLYEFRPCLEYQVKIPAREENEMILGTLIVVSMR
jgi:hypothetical protein